MTSFHLSLPTRAATILAAIVIGYFSQTLQLSAAERAADARFDRAVSVAKTTQMCFADTIQVSGVVVAGNEIQVRPEREGLKISQVLVEPGDTVTSAQVLARLTPPDGSPGGTATVNVTAPAAGVVNAVSAVIGNVASARAEPLFRIARQGEMEMLAETPANSLARLAAEQTAKIEIIGAGEMTGKIKLVSTTINPTTQLGQVRLSIGANQKLRVGAFGRAIINVGQRCGVAIPFSAVGYGQDGTVVQVVRDNQIESRRVTVGLLADDRIEVREGLSTGEVIVARAAAFVRDGDRVRPVNASEPSARR